MSSGFISETELAERRRTRQEEWEKVRQADQPEVAPEEQFDHRSLFDRLEEQKQKKQQDYEEAHKLKNMIKGLDDDEVDFLDLVDRKKMEAEQIKELEEKQELLEFRKKVEKLQEESIDRRIQAEVRPSKVFTTNNGCSLSSQHKLLKGVVVRKRSGEIEMDKNEKTMINHDVESKRKRVDEAVEKSISHNPKIENSGLTCVGILPSLCNYPESSEESDHSCSSDSDLESQTKFDLVGRKIVYKSKLEENTEG